MAGPVTGVTATGFNGSSSWIPLDGAWCSTPGTASSCFLIPDSGRVVTTAPSLALSIWFKTTGTSGVLLGATGTLPGQTSCVSACADMPLLWIGSNGHLEGLGSTGHSVISGTNYTATALSSSAAVNDGAWHQAVLVPGQALYLDGAEVATGTASVTLPAGAAVLLGAGVTAGSQCSNCMSGSSTGWQYFNGSMADLSVYQDQLPSSGTVAAQYAAETHSAAELNSVTSPGGRNELSATYDTVNDRVATVADANGGTWTYSRAVPGSSSGAYDGAVLGSSPEDFWPLNDVTGPLARDMVGGAATAASPRPPATYSNVALGGAGPTGFADGTSAAFSGSSQVSIPGGYFAAAGPETVELWFKTTKSGTMLSSASGPSGGEPVTLWVASMGGCIEGQVGSAILNEAIFGCTTGAVNDGKWHQAVVTVSPSTSVSFPGAPGSPTRTATLYLDGKSLSTAPLSGAGTPSATGYTAVLGTGPSGSQPYQPSGPYTGSIADVSLYTRALSAQDVTAHYNALQVTVAVSQSTMFGGSTKVATPTLNAQTVTITAPNGAHTSYLYASGALTRTTDPLGGATIYGYDAASRASTITDPDGDTTYLTYDAHNNITSTTTCATVSSCQTSYASYYENLANPLDPRNDKPTDSRDARSTSPTDPTYDTTTSYTSAGLIATKTAPPTAACPAGCQTSYAYTKGTEAAVGGGTEPAGLMASITGSGGGVTSYAYNSAGDVMQTTSPLGLVTKYTYDNLGRELSETQVSDSYPAGLTTSFSYDSRGRVVTEKDPAVTDRVTGAVHTEVFSYTYDPDSNVTSTTISDATGGDPSRTTTATYNAQDEMASTTDALGHTTSYTYDSMGNKASETDASGSITAYTYDADGHLLTTTLDGYTGNPSSPSAPVNLVQESRAYDPAGRLASVTNVKGTTTAYTYYGNNQLASSFIVDPASSTGAERVTTYGYDAAGNETTETDPGGLVINGVYNADDQVVSYTQDPAGADSVAKASYDPAGNMVADTLTQGGVTQTTTATYNAVNQLLSETVDNTGGNLATSVCQGPARPGDRGNRSGRQHHPYPERRGRASRPCRSARRCRSRPAAARHRSPPARSPWPATTPSVTGSRPPTRTGTSARRPSTRAARRSRSPARPTLRRGRARPWAALRR